MDVMKKTKDTKQNRLGNRYSASLLIIAGIFLFGISGLMWWSRIYQDPERVFRGMLANSLSTPSVTRSITQSAQGNELEQHIELSLGTQNRSHAVSILRQNSGDAETKVTTESIGTTESDYTRYVKIETDQKNAEGEPLDFSEILRIWGKNDAQNAEAGAAARYFNEALLGVVPFASLSPADRQSLIQFMQDRGVFEVNYDDAERRQENRRSTYIYDVTIRPQTYVAMLQTFTKMLGLESIDGLQQENYEGVPPLEVEMSVDAVSRQLTSIRYKANGRQERYSGHGARKEITIPQETIPVAELQNRLQAIR